MTMTKRFLRYDAALSGRKSGGGLLLPHTREHGVKIKITVTFTKGAKFSSAVTTKHTDEYNSTW
jgi:hypothetical protein